MGYRIFLLALVVVAYSPTLGGDFYFDDFALFSDPAVIRADGPAFLLGLDRTRPLTYFTLWANYQAGGLEPFGYHLVNVAVFVLACFLAGDLFPRLIGPRGGAIAAAIFCLHPLQTEAVGYSYGRAGVLSLLFCLVAWRLWIAGRLRGAGVVFVAAVLSKEDAVVFPVFLAGYELIFRRASQADWQRFRGPLLAMLAVSMLAGAQALLATTVVEGAGAGFAVESLSPLGYLASQGRAILLYLRLLALPVGLNFDHDLSAAAGAAFSWIPLLLMAGGAFWFLRHKPERFWILGALVLLAPTSSIVPLADLAAERRMVLPLMSLSLLLGGLTTKVSGRVAGVVLAVMLSVLTFQRNQVWASPEALWRDAAEKSPGKVRPKLQLARALPPESAERATLLAGARALQPENIDVLLEFGVERLRTGDAAGALGEFDLAARIAPALSQIAANRGAALIMLGREAEGEAAFLESLEQDPCSFDARNNLILVRKAQGRESEAQRLAIDAPRNCRWTEAQLEVIRAASGPL